MFNADATMKNRINTARMSGKTNNAQMSVGDRKQH